VQDLLAQPAVRWITLLGPGGIGKTRLAQEVVVRVRAGRLPVPGALWVPLAAVETEAGLHDALAAALGLPAGGGRVADQLRAALAERQTLLVLDNVEQLQHLSGALQALAQAAPGVRWLATSREVLGLAGEHVLALTGLATTGPAAPALALLAEHAQRHGCALDLADAQGAAAAQRLVAGVQGLPLAIELAAAWLPVIHFATLSGMLGLSGFTSRLCSWGRSTTSMSSIGIAPTSSSIRREWAPRQWIRPQSWQRPKRLQAFQVWGGRCCGVRTSFRHPWKRNQARAFPVTAPLCLPVPALRTPPPLPAVPR
jgi:hypothetical protein